VTRPLSATAWLPARADPFRESTAQPTADTTAAEPGVLSVTVTIEEEPGHAARRFAFRAARQAERRQFSRRSTDRDQGGAFAIADQRSDPNAILDQHDPHASSHFLAGAIAQARPGTALHNPRYREAVGAYRRSDLLGIDADRARRHSDKKV
jgi:hypothetical protein